MNMIKKITMSLLCVGVMPQQICCIKKVSETAPALNKLLQNIPQQPFSTTPSPEGFFSKRPFPQPLKVEKIKMQIVEKRYENAMRELQEAINFTQQQYEEEKKKFGGGPTWKTYATRFLLLPVAIGIGAAYYQNQDTINDKLVEIKNTVVGIRNKIENYFWQKPTPNKQENPLKVIAQSKSKFEEAKKAELQPYIDAAETGSLTDKFVPLWKGTQDPTEGVDLVKRFLNQTVDGETFKNKLFNAALLANNEDNLNALKNYMVLTTDGKIGELSLTDSQIGKLNEKSLNYLIENVDKDILNNKKNLLFNIALSILKTPITFTENTLQIKQANTDTLQYLRDYVLKKTNNKIGEMPLSINQILNLPEGKLIYLLKNVDPAVLKTVFNADFFKTAALQRKFTPLKIIAQVEKLVNVKLKDITDRSDLFEEEKIKTFENMAKQVQKNKPNVISEVQQKPKSEEGIWTQFKHAFHKS